MPVPLGSVVSTARFTVVLLVLSCVISSTSVGWGGVRVMVLVLAAETLPAASLTNRDTLCTPLPVLSLAVVGGVSFQSEDSVGAVVPSTIAYLAMGEPPSA